MNEFRARLSKIEYLKSKCSGILLYNADGWSNPNFFWLSNTSVNGWLWVPFKGRARLFVSKMYREEARSVRAKTTFITDFKAVLREFKGEKAGVDLLHLPAAALSKVKSYVSVKDVSEDLEAARAVKTPYEVKQIRKACGITAEILRSLELPRGISKTSVLLCMTNRSSPARAKHGFALCRRSHTSPRITEAKLRADIDWEMSQRGLEPAFPTIVASGKSIATPHHIPAKKPILGTLLIDLGVRYNGYCSDVSRTFGSKYKPLIRKIIFETIEPLLKPGARAADINAAAQNALGRYAKYYITGLGHGVGIAIHEDPSITAKSKDVLQAGNVIAIEPGIYVPGGIRHENVYLITKHGAENLTDF